MGYRLQNKHLTTEKQMTTAFGHDCGKQWSSIL